MSVDCPGCGEPLPPARGRGRPAVYHGASCRQRARRSRLAARPAVAGVLDTLRRVDAASAAARRAVLAGSDPDEALAELITAVAAISPTAVATPDVPAASTPPARTPLAREVSDGPAPVVRRPAAPARSRRTHSVPPRSQDSAGSTRAVTKSVTDDPAEHPRYADSRDVIDPATMRMSKSTQFAVDGNYLLTAGTSDDPVLVGFVRQRAYGSTWVAQIAGSGSALPDGPWKTRRQAANNLLLIASKVVGFSLS